MGRYLARYCRKGMGGKMSFILKAIAGSAGSYILITVLAAFAALGSYAGLETWRLHTAQSKLAVAEANYHTCGVDNLALTAAIKQANKDTDDAKAAADDAQVRSNATAARSLSRPHVAILPGAASLNKWLEGQP